MWLLEGRTLQAAGEASAKALRHKEGLSMLGMLNVPEKQEGGQCDSGRRAGISEGLLGWGLSPMTRGIQESR